MTLQPVQIDGRHLYKVKSGSPIPKARAQEIGEYIADLETQIDITPPSLLDDARRKDSKLHEFFEWNNKNAGNKWRLQQARSILNHFEVVVVDMKTEDETAVRAWHSVVSVSDQDDGKIFASDASTTKDNGDMPDDPLPARSYVSIVRAMSTPDLRKQVIDNALREAQSWRKRYSTYNELEPIFTVIDEIVETNGTE